MKLLFYIIFIIFNNEFLLLKEVNLNLFINCMIDIIFIFIILK